MEAAVSVLTLEPESRSPSRARRFAAEALDRWGLQSLADTVALLVSELVTNAVLHARTEVVLRLRPVGPDGVRVEVEDGSAVPPRVRRYGPDSATGRGLAMVDRMAGSWGAEPTPAGKRTWFTLTESDVAACWASFDLGAAEAV